MTRAAPELARAALKTAVRRLLAALGGSDAASTVTRVVKSKLHNYGDARMPDRNMPIDVLLDLEMCLGNPIVTGELARLAGYMIMPLDLGEGDAARALAEVARDCGRTLADGLRALDDGLPPEETDLVLTDLAELGGAVNSAVGILRARQRKQCA